MRETGFADGRPSTEADTWVFVEAHKRKDFMAENRKSTVIAIGARFRPTKSQRRRNRLGAFAESHRQRPAQVTTFELSLTWF